MDLTALNAQELQLGSEIGNLTLWESMARRTAMHPYREALVVRLQHSRFRSLNYRGLHGTLQSSTVKSTHDHSFAVNIGKRLAESD